MNKIAEVREEYKSAARTYIEHLNTKEYPKSMAFYEGRLSGLAVALSCLGVNSDEIREMYSTCEGEARNEKEQEEAGDRTMKKVVKADRGAAVVNDKEVIEITGTWKASDELRNLLKNFSGD